MNPFLLASFQAIHDVIQTGIHCYHFKDGAFEDKIALKQQVGNSLEIITALGLLIASSTTSSAEQAEFKKMLDCLVMMSRMEDIAKWYSKDDAELLQVGIDNLRVPFVEDHRQRTIDQRLADFQAIYMKKNGPASDQIMLVELGGDLIGFCKGSKSGLVPYKTDTELEKAAHAAWMADMAGNLTPAQAAKEAKEPEGEKSKKKWKKSKKSKKKSKRTKKAAHQKGKAEELVSEVGHDEEPAEAQSPSSDNLQD